MSCDGIRAILTGEGYETDVVYDGDTGLDCIMSRVYDLVLLDVMLPGINGISILEKIRQEKISVPVIMLTAKTLKEDTVEFYNSHHPDPNDPDKDIPIDEQFPQGMFRFEKKMGD